MRDNDARYQNTGNAMTYKVSADGIHRPSIQVQHRNEEYDQASFNTLWAMQDRHFWYRGRHRFLLAVLDRIMAGSKEPWRAVDLGGGVGGWIRHLVEMRGDRFSKLVLADSSEMALQMAGDVLPQLVDRYQIDLMDLGWHNQWDCAFLLDVIEHIPDDVKALREASLALKPGGYLIVTAPALRQFWSYNDELVHHLRRYNRVDFANLAQASGLELCDARYFMFLLSPLYWLSRKWKTTQGMSEDQKRAHIKQTHQVPNILINGALTIVFAAETPLGQVVRFPWGTSILGVFRKP